jgi:hypothetical protein
MDAIKACHEAVHAMGTPRIAVSTARARSRAQLTLGSTDGYPYRYASGQGDQQGRKLGQSLPSRRDLEKGPTIIVVLIEQWHSMYHIDTFIQWLHMRLAIQRSSDDLCATPTVSFGIQLFPFCPIKSYTFGFFLCSARIAWISSLTSVIVGRSAGSCCHIRSSSSTTSVPHRLRMANVEGLESHHQHDTARKKKLLTSVSSCQLHQ